MRAEGSPAKLRPGGQSYYSASPKLDSFVQFWGLVDDQ